MKIEEEIQQAQFSNEWLKGLVNIMFTCNWVEEKQKELLKKYQLTLQQYNVLRILRGQLPNSISTSVIRERMIDRASDTSRIVDRLHEKGVVDKRACRTDRRLVDVKINAHGLQILAEIDNEGAQISNILANLTEEETKTLNQLLDKIREV